MVDLIFPKPEPEMYDKHLSTVGISMESLEHIAWRVEKEHYDNFNSVSRECRQNILKIFRKGECIGDVAKILGIDSMVVADVIYY